jgi:hypothetical protein
LKDWFICVKNVEDSTLMDSLSFKIATLGLYSIFYKFTLINISFSIINKVTQYESLILRKFLRGMKLLVINSADLKIKLYKYSSGFLIWMGVYCLDRAHYFGKICYFGGRHIILVEDTLFWWKTHYFGGRHIILVKSTLFW